MVPHYFVGTKSIRDYYNASMYEQDVLRLLEGSNNPLPSTFNPPPFTLNPQPSTLHLLSGGSMMYVDAVCNGIDDIPTVRDDVRELMKSRLEREGLEALCEELRQ